MYILFSMCVGMSVLGPKIKGQWLNKAFSVRPKGGKADFFNLNQKKKSRKSKKSEKSKSRSK